jgi:hypothetical protein
VNEALRDELHAHMLSVGVEIQRFLLTEISYAPVIAAGMLKRQQAQATVAARKAIVTGAVSIATGAIDELKARNITLEPKDQAKVVTNLLTVITSDTGVTPTLSVE